jgi:hypothetical protein
MDMVSSSAEEASGSTSGSAISPIARRRDADFIRLCVFIVVGVETLSDGLLFQNRPASVPQNGNREAGAEKLIIS